MKCLAWMQCGDVSEVGILRVFLFRNELGAAAMRLHVRRTDLLISDLHEVAIELLLLQGGIRSEPYDQIPPARRPIMHQHESYWQWPSAPRQWRRLSSFYNESRYLA